MYNPKEDRVFENPFKDVDEQRERNGLVFRYIHGGFKDTNVKFSFCFPEKEQYEGRFYHFLSPFPGPNEELASLTPERKGMEDHVTFALTHGAYFVESNMGSGSAFGSNSDPTILYRSSAAVAEYSREVAREIYGGERPYGYVYGGSGGGYKTCGCIENTVAFDGAVPFVTACPVALPNIMTVTAHAVRILRDKLDSIADAIEPGSDHDIYSGLNEEEREAFQEVTKMGIPVEAWLGMKHADDGGFAVIAPAVRSIDPEYFVDFWNKPGYLGSVRDGSAVWDRIKLRTTIKKIYIPTQENTQQGTEPAIDGRNGVDTAWQKMIIGSKSDEKIYIEISELPENGFSYIKGINITFLSGKAQGKSLPLAALNGKMLIIEKAYGEGSLEDILSQAECGDEVLVDNSDYIAIQTYHRHQVPDAEYTVWDQFRSSDGTPKYPQRDNLICMGFAYQGAGSIQSGNIQGKVIMVNCLADGGACTWMSDWYRSKVGQIYAEDINNRFRLWVLEHCGHTDQEATADELHIPSYLGVLYQALIDIAAWVEKGIEPAATSNYKISDGQAFVPDTAQERRGIQPVVKLKVNGEKSAQVQVGEKVFLQAEVGFPESNSRITAIEWSFAGESYRLGKMEETYSYGKAGTYFVTVRVKINRTTDPFTEIQNLDRVRIVVK